MYECYELLERSNTITISLEQVNAFYEYNVTIILWRLMAIAYSQKVNKANSTLALKPHTDE